MKTLNLVRSTAIALIAMATVFSALATADSVITTDGTYIDVPAGQKVVFVPIGTPEVLVKATGITLITPERTLTLGGGSEVDTGPWYDFYDLDKDGVIDGKSAEGCEYDPYDKSTLDACYGR